MSQPWLLGSQSQSPLVVQHSHLALCLPVNKDTHELINDDRLWMRIPTIVGQIVKSKQFLVATFILAPKRSLCEYSLCEIFSELMPEILSYARNQFIFPLHKDIFVRRLGINPRARSLKVVYCMRVIVWHTRQWHEQRPVLHASFVGK